MAIATRSKKKSTSSRRPARAGRNSSQSEKIQLGLKRRLLSPAFMIVSGAFIFAITIIFLGILWFTKIYADPQHVFWTTIEQSLATQSITKNSLRQGSGSSNIEFTSVAFSPELRVHDIKQITDTSTKPASKLTIETIGTATTDYQRYSHIERPDSAMKQRDYQRIYDAWLKNGGQMGGSGQIVGNTLFGAVLFGDFNPQTRGRLFNELKKSYQVDFAAVNKKGDGHRRVYIYHATIPLTKYAVAAHDYAQALQLPLADQINPNNYQPSDQLDVNITIDVLSRQIKKIEYINRSFIENLSGQGNVVELELPSKTVSAQQFQNAIKSLNQ